MRTFFLLHIVLALARVATAQDPHFSQYASAPLFVNPAMTAVMPHDYRLTAKYRDQWRSVLEEAAYQTYMAAFEGKIFCPDAQGSFLSGGLAVLTDQAGSNGFQTTQANATIAYHLQLNGNDRQGAMLAGGLQAGLLQYRLRGDALRFEEQFTAMGFNPNLPSFEEDLLRDQTPWLLDMALGVALYNLNGQYEFGLGLFHANQPTYSFKSVGEAISPRVNMRLSVHGSWQFEFYDQAALRVRNLFMVQRPITEFHHWQNQLGLEGQWWFERLRRELMVGAAFRLAGHQDGEPLVIDALVLSAEVDFSPLTLGFAYDINLTGLNAVSTGRGGFELTMQVGLDRRNSCVSCRF